MTKKSVASLLICALMMSALAPPKASAQTATQLGMASGERTLRDERARPKTDLKATFTGEIARIKSGGLTDAELKRIGKARQSQQGGGGGWSKRDTVWMTAFVVSMTVLIVVLVKHGLRAPPSCQDEPGDINCV